MKLISHQTIDGVECKRCYKCQEWQPLDQFTRAAGRPDGLQPQCKTCDQAHRAAHRDQINAYAARYRAEQQDRVREKIRQWRAEHPDYCRTYHAQNRTRRNAQNRAWQAAHPGWAQEWDRRNADKRREISRRRRRRVYDAPGTHTEQEWEALKGVYGYRCLHCQRAEPEIALTRDHVIPLSKGGSDDIGNIQPLCLSCNDSKGVQTVDYRPA